VPNLVASRRRALGLSQQDLATASHLSRQLISAVERGRHVPNVVAALAIAKALGAPVEEIFGAAPDVYLPALGRLPADGAGVVAVRVGEPIVYHPVADTCSSWGRADGTYRDGRVELFPDSDPSGFAVAGCDPALGLAASMLPQRGPRRLVSILASTGQAIRALDAGRLHGGLVHGPAGRLPGNSSPVLRWTLARWKVGLAFPPGFRLDLERLARGGIRVAQQDPDAEVQRAFARALRSAGGTANVRGPVASGHLDAAHRVEEGSVKVAVTMETAARAFGLAFFELEEHVSELRIAVSWLDHPGAQALLELIASPPFLARLAALGGYDLSEAGQPRWGEAPDA
jgi:DNA-binding XRE family transcriptional regulator